MWNLKQLSPPPINTFRAKSYTVDIKNVKSILRNGISTLKIPSAINVESALLRRFIYRNKLQFRCDKGFKNIELTNRSLNKLRTFNIVEDLEYLLEFVPEQYNKDIFLPTKQMLDYVLIRMQGFSQVCSRVAEFSLATAKLMNARLALGHQWQAGLIALALCSRIWQICKHLTLKCCLTYNELLPLRDKLEMIGTKFLPEDYEFPEDLKKWLNIDWLQETPDIISQLSIDLPIFSLLDDDDDDDEVKYCGEYILDDCIVIQDTEIDDDIMEIDDVEFVSKGKEKLNKSPRNIKEETSNDLSDSETDNKENSIISIQDDTDEELDDAKSKKWKGILNVSGVIPLIDDDIGETISRDKLISLVKNNEKKLPSKSTKKGKNRRGKKRKLDEKRKFKMSAKKLGMVQKKERKSIVKKEKKFNVKSIKKEKIKCEKM